MCVCVCACVSVCVCVGKKCSKINSYLKSEIRLHLDALIDEQRRADGLKTVEKKLPQLKSCHCHK